MGLGFRVFGSGFRGLGVYGDLIIIYPKPYSIYLRGTIRFTVSTSIPASSGNWRCSVLHQ